MILTQALFSNRSYPALGKQLFMITVDIRQTFSLSDWICWSDGISNIWLGFSSLQITLFWPNRIFENFRKYFRSYDIDRR